MTAIRLPRDDSDPIANPCSRGSAAFDTMALRPGATANLLGFAVFAIIAVFLLKVFFGLFGLVLGLLGTILWLAFLGFLIYLVLKLFAPETAARVREMIAGRA